jgi:hypothetical protein
LLMKRARLMEAWAIYCTVPGDDSNRIIPFVQDHTTTKFRVQATETKADFRNAGESTPASVTCGCE